MKAISIEANGNQSAVQSQSQRMTPKTAVLVFLATSPLYRHAARQLLQ